MPTKQKICAFLIDNGPKIYRYSFDIYLFSVSAFFLFKGKPVLGLIYALVLLLSNTVWALYDIKTAIQARTTRILYLEPDNKSEPTKSTNVK